MINKLIIDGVNTQLDENSPIPYTYVFSQAKVHTVKLALDDTTEICAEAFKDCPNLTKITIPEEITMIKRRAFENCTGLKRIDIPESIQYIGANTFDGCTNLDDVTFVSAVPPEVYCDFPQNTTCFVPDNSKYIAVETEDLTKCVTDGSVKYYTKNFYGAYSEIPNPNNIDTTGQVTYYTDAWVTVAPNKQTKEYKDRVPIDEISFGYELLPIAANSTPIISYTLLPENETNHRLTWISGKTDIVEVLDTSVAGQCMLKTGNTGTTTLTAYAESGAYAQIILRLTGGSAVTPDTPTPDEPIVEPEPEITPLRDAMLKAAVFYADPDVVEAGMLDTISKDNGDFLTAFTDIRWMSYNGISFKVDKSAQQQIDGANALNITDYLSTLTGTEPWSGDANLANSTNIIKLNNGGKWYMISTPINGHITEFTVKGTVNKNKSASDGSWIAFNPDNTTAYDSKGNKVAAETVKCWPEAFENEKPTESNISAVHENVQRLVFNSNTLEQYRIVVKDPKKAIYYMCGNGTDSDKTQASSVSSLFTYPNKCIYLHAEVKGTILPFTASYENDVKLVNVVETPVAELSSLDFISWTDNTVQYGADAGSGSTDAGSGSTDAPTTTAIKGMISVGDKGDIYRIKTDGSAEKIVSTGHNLEGVTVDGNGDIYVVDEEDNCIYKLVNNSLVNVTREADKEYLLAEYHPKTNGFEAIAWIENDEFFLGSQDTPTIVRYSLSKGIISEQVISCIEEIADFDYDSTNKLLYVVNSQTSVIYALDAEDLNICKHVIVLPIPSVANIESIAIDNVNKLIYAGSDYSGNKLYTLKVENIEGGNKSADIISSDEPEKDLNTYVSAITVGDINGEIGDELELKVNVTPKDATDPSYTITCPKGTLNGNKITFNEAGQFTITVTANDAHKVSATCKATITVHREYAALNVGDVMINEVYYTDQADGYKYVELYNTTDAEIELGKCVFEKGKSMDETSADFFPDTVTFSAAEKIAAKGYYLIKFKKDEIKPNQMSCGIAGDTFAIRLKDSKGTVIDLVENIPASETETASPNYHNYKTDNTCVCCGRTRDGGSEWAGLSEITLGEPNWVATITVNNKCTSGVYAGSEYEFDYEVIKDNDGAAIASETIVCKTDATLVVTDKKITIAEAGNYTFTVTVTDVNGIIGTTDIVVKIIEVPTEEVSGTTAEYSGGSVTLTGATFEDGTVTLEGATYEDGNVSLNSAANEIK